jgi:hypothetical protein
MSKPLGWDSAGAAASASTGPLRTMRQGRELCGMRHVRIAVSVRVDSRNLIVPWIGAARPTHSSTLSVSVVVSKLCEQKRTALNRVDHSVLVIDTPRPVTRQSVLELLRFPNPRKWFTLYFSNQLVDTLNHLLVLLLPVKVIFPRLVSKD